MFRNLYNLHKIGHYCIRHKIPIIPQFLTMIKRLLFPACDIPFSTVIGNGCIFPHRAIGVVIHGNAIIGKNTKIETNVTIGGSPGKNVPVIGDNCYIGTGSCIVGGVHVGNDVIVGAGAVVVKDVADGYIVGGVPATVIKKVPEEWIGKSK